MDAALLAEARAALRQPGPLLVLTGAGMSAESGVPTFRDAQTGLWAQFRPEDLATPEAFSRDPATVWRWYVWRRQRVIEAQPHAGHLALARWLSRHPQATLITQNVDGLHGRAQAEIEADAFADEYPALPGREFTTPTTRIVELHGNLLRTICARTRRLVDESWLRRHVAAVPVPSPHSPGDWCRPDVVWFGEALPMLALSHAQAASARGGVCLIVGTSGLVQPAASLPLLAKQAGARLIEVNPEPSALSEFVDLHLPLSAREGLPALLDP
ncbi:MAG: NAD-dependent deacylase [Xanthomonadales bacterium]|jgi:NAD-dependent deacetylase|nr:NAD-dependent deacylase [Xanthomonadales bacterium]